jgi:hypothetical protein
MLIMLRAAFVAKSFLVSAYPGDDRFELADWPPVHRRTLPRWIPSRRRVTSAVVRLRVAQRLLLGFIDPVRDAVFLTAGLRRLGLPASFHLGREIVASAPPAGFFAWVECEGRVVSTSLPVREEYIEVHRVAAR